MSRNESEQPRCEVPLKHMAWTMIGPWWKCPRLLWFTNWEQSPHPAPQVISIYSYSCRVDLTLRQITDTGIATNIQINSRWATVYLMHQGLKLQYELSTRLLWNFCRSSQSVELTSILIKYIMLTANWSWRGNGLHEGNLTERRGEKEHSLWGLILLSSQFNHTGAQ